MKRFFLGAFVFFIGLLVMACQGRSTDTSPKKEKIITVKMQTPTQALYYNGVLAPLAMQSVLSPVEGRVAKINFSYGQFVKKGKLLLAIDSMSLTQDYRKSISNYLQKKSAYANSLEEFRGSNALYKAGVISRQEFINSQTQYRTNQLNYYQSRYGMEKILSKVDINSKDIEHLTINDASKINQLLQRQLKHIVVHSSADGIVLFPMDNGNSSEESDSKQLELGSLVKQGQLLLTIGNLTGLSTQIHVNEVNIDQIHVGMSATIKISAFPKLVLKGYVAEVSSQAKSSSQNSGSAEFPISIKIPKITPAQRKKIRVGMTAKVTIVMHQQPTILLPIRAVYEKDGQSVVTIVNKFGRRKVTPVVVDFTMAKQVSVVKGLEAGDRVVVPQSSV